MEGVTIDEILERAIPHDEYSPLNIQLRRAIQVSAVTTGAAIPIGLFGATMLAQFGLGGLLDGLGGMVVWPLVLMASPLGFVVNGLALLVYGWLWYATDSLAEGHLVWHKVGVALAAIGAFYVLAILLPVVWGFASIVLTVVFWIVASILVIVVVLFFLAIAASS